MKTKFNVEEYINKRFGRLIVIEYAGKVNSHHFVKCQCDCGTIKIIRVDGLRTGNVLSCGCFHRDRLTTHGYTNTPTYKTWDAMIARCYNENATGYELYGGRGITVCEKWKTFSNFLEDMGPCPKNKTLDRIDNNGCYELKNCRWATRKEQARNRSSNVILTVNGVSKCMSEWAEEVGTYRNLIYSRLKRGWSAYDAIMEPLHPKSLSTK